MRFAIAGAALVALVACSSGGDREPCPPVQTRLVLLDDARAWNNACWIKLSPNAPHALAVWHQERFEVAVRNGLPAFPRTPGDDSQFPSNEVQVQAAVLYFGLTAEQEWDYRARMAHILAWAPVYGIELSQAEVFEAMRAYRDQARAWVRRPEIVAEAGVVRERLEAWREASR